MKFIICNLLILLSQFIYGIEMDIKLSLLTDDKTFINITNMLNKHKIIVFKNQNITKDEQITISEYWGYIKKQPYGNRPLYKNKLLIIELSSSSNSRLSVLLIILDIPKQNLLD